MATMMLSLSGKAYATTAATPANAADYLALPNVLAVGGSWLTPKAAVAAQDWTEITRLAQAAGALRA